MNKNMTDIRLSKRMQTVVSMVKEKTVADIGCDHAFVSIYLMKTGMCNKVVAMDVKKGPLDIAGSNVKAYGLEDRISIRLSDGFQNLEKGETECAIIAGMGGNLMIDILKAGRIHTDNGIKLVLQPQSDIELVRAYIAEVGYCIENEDMLIEDGKFYTVMRAVPAESFSDGVLHSENKKIKYNDYELNFGPCLLRDKSNVLRQYLDRLYNKNNELIDELCKVNTESSRERTDELVYENNFIKKTIELYYA